MWTLDFHFADFNFAVWWQNVLARGFCFLSSGKSEPDHIPSRILYIHCRLLKVPHASQR